MPSSASQLGPRAGFGRGRHADEGVRAPGLGSQDRSGEWVASATRRRILGQLSGKRAGDPFAGPS